MQATPQSPRHNDAKPTYLAKSAEHLTLLNWPTGRINNTALPPHHPTLRVIDAANVIEDPLPRIKDLGLRGLSCKE
jgi:hypothetical protein